MTMHRNNKDGSYNVRGYGGARQGAGRPATGRRKRMIYVTDEELEAIKVMLEKIREETEGSR